MAALCGRRINGGNLVSKLLFREVRGSLQTHKHQRKEKVFKKIPGRLCFKLTSLVPRILLDEGYVFLGFSKDGQFVISYSLQVDADENTGFLPVYVYNLQWWWFIPYKPLKKVSEVRLFEDGIEPDIFIAVCEWPADRSKILVYGLCIPRDREEGTQCFITITAVPPLSNCKDCYIAETNFPCVKHKNKVMCLKHSFCIYCKYELAPPFPSFIPQIQLKMDGVVVLNTGDSLVALDFRIHQPPTSCGGARQGGGGSGGAHTQDLSNRLFSRGGSTISANSGSSVENNANSQTGYYNARGGIPSTGSDSAAESDDEGCWWAWNRAKATPPPTTTSISSSPSSASACSNPTSSSTTSMNTNGGGGGNGGSSTSMTSSVSRCCQRTKFHPVNPSSNADQTEPQPPYLCCSTCCSESSATACCRHSKTTTGHCRNCENCENTCPLGTGGGDEEAPLGKPPSSPLKQQPLLPCCPVCDRTLTPPSCLHHHLNHHHHHLNNHHHHISSPPAPPAPPSSSPPTSCCDTTTTNHPNRLSDPNSRRGGRRCCTCASSDASSAKTDSSASSPLPPSPSPSAVLLKHNTKLNILGDCPPNCFCGSVGAGDPEDSKENMVESTSLPHPNNNNNTTNDPYYFAPFSPSNSSSAGSTPTTGNENKLPDHLHQNKSRSMSFSLKKFTYLTEETNDIFLNEDEFDYAYPSILPLEVRGTDQKMMKATKSNTDSNHPDHITVCQLMLDIEHFLEEVIHNTAEWGHRYIAFLNYDLQLLDVNAESGEVLAKVFALVQARKDLNEHKDLKRGNRPRQYYQTSITFNWSLLTGNYETFHIEDLSEVNESDLLRKEWNPGNGEVSKLQQSLAIPQSFYNRVYTLTNDAVLKGHSLTTIVAPHHFVAISR